MKRSTHRHKIVVESKTKILGTRGKNNNINTTLNIELCKKRKAGTSNFVLSDQF